MISNEVDKEIAKINKARKNSGMEEYKGEVQNIQKSKQYIERQRKSIEDYTRENNEPDANAYDDQQQRHGRRWIFRCYGCRCLSITIVSGQVGTDEEKRQQI